MRGAIWTSVLNSLSLVSGCVLTSAGSRGPGYVLERVVPAAAAAPNHVVGGSPDVLYHPKLGIVITHVVIVGVVAPAASAPAAPAPPGGSATRAVPAEEGVGRAAVPLENALVEVQRVAEVGMLVQVVMNVQVGIHVHLLVKQVLHDVVLLLQDRDFGVQRLGLLADRDGLVLGNDRGVVPCSVRNLLQVVIGLVKFGREPFGARVVVIEDAFDRRLAGVIVARLRDLSKQLPAVPEDLVRFLAQFRELPANVQHPRGDHFVEVACLRKPLLVDPGNFEGGFFVQCVQRAPELYCLRFFGLTRGGRAVAHQDQKA